MRFFSTCLTFFLFLTSHALAHPLVLNEIAHLHDDKKLPVPNPKELHPMWWNYFDAEGEELQHRIQRMLNLLQGTYATLALEDQTAALPLINKIATTLNALPQAKQQQTALIPFTRQFLPKYTLKKQIDLHQHIRKLKGDIKIEEERITDLKERIAKIQQHVDNMMAAYIALSSAAPQKVLRGLEIISYGVNIGVGHNKLLLAERSLEDSKSLLERFEEELAYSKLHMDASEFDENGLEVAIAHLQNEFEKKQSEVANAEANLLNIFSDQYHDKQTNFLYEQQLLQALVGRAYAWSQLCLQTLKYNLLMYLNGRFETTSYAFRDNLNSWRQQVATMFQQSLEWKRSARKEQERLSQAYAFSFANTDPADYKKLQSAQSMQKGVVHILATLDLLEDELSRIELLITLLNEQVRKNNNFLQNLWIQISDVFSKSMGYIHRAFHASLFKVSGIPITTFTLLKILVILSISFWLSRFVRTSLIRFGKARGEITESTLYSLGSLAHYAVLLIGIIIALSSAGLDFGNLVFVVGALIFGVSFGLQSLANNFFCGLRILFERKLHIGDSVELHSGQEGRVTEIHVQNTVVRTNDGQKVIVPNSELIGHTLVKWSRHHHDYRRLHIPFAVAMESDKELVRQVVIDAAKRVPAALKDPEYSEPQVWLLNFNHHALEFELVVWIDYDADAITDSHDADFLWEIETALRENNIAFPPPLFHHLLSPHKPAGEASVSSSSAHH